MKLREAIQVDQLKLPVIMKGSGLSRAVLGDFLADGMLAEQQALQLHSYLYYREEEFQEKQEKLNTGKGWVKLWERWNLMRREAKKEFNILWQSGKNFRQLSVEQQRTELRHLEERLKAELIYANKELIRQRNIRLQDGQDYWFWKGKIDAYKASPPARRPRPTGARSRDGSILPARGARPPLPWRGREKA